MLSHYPLDLIANRMEASIALESPKMNMTSHIKEIYTHQGISGFFRGLGPCLLRAIPTNATIFLTYDLCKLYWDSVDDAKNTWLIPENTVTWRYIYQYADKYLLIS